MGKGGEKKRKKRGGGKDHTHPALSDSTQQQHATKKLNIQRKKRTDGLSDVGSPFSHRGVAVHQRLLFLQVLDLVVVRQAVRAA